MSEKARHNEGDFFIPDICAPQPTLFLILLMELLVLAYVLATSNLPEFNWESFAILSLFAQWLLMLSAWLLCRFRERLSEFSVPGATIASLALVSVAAISGSLFVQILLPEIIDSSNDLWWVLRNLLVANMLAAASLRYFYLQQQLRLRDKWAMLARLDAMSARIRPHFLFNTLNSIASLIGSRPKIAEQAVEDLAELFRVSLKESHENTTVADEIHLTTRYLEIEKLRLGDRLSITWSVDEALLTMPMPSLIIQPLAENAVYHGISQIPEGGCLEISIQLESGLLAVRLSNPIPAEDAGTEGNRMALSNVEQRLKAIYGEGASVLADRSNGIFTVVLKYEPAPFVN